MRSDDTIILHGTYSSAMRSGRRTERVIALAAKASGRAHRRSGSASIRLGGPRLIRRYLLDGLHDDYLWPGPDHMRPQAIQVAVARSAFDQRFRFPAQKIYR